MSTYCIRLFIFSSFFCLVKLSFAQNDFSILNESNISINHNISQTYKLNFSFKGRNFLFRNKEITIRQRQVEIGHFSRFSMTPRSSLSIGVMYRNKNWFDELENEFRTTIQFNTKHILESLRFGQRYRAEQRFFETFTTFRFRYRLALDFPLQGEQLNVGEPYFIGTGEFLWSMTRHIKPELDHRWSVQIGWLLVKRTKLQVGLEYRFDQFNTYLNQKLFLLTAAVFNL